MTHMMHQMEKKEGTSKCKGLMVAIRPGSHLGRPGSASSKVPHSAQSAHHCSTLRATYQDASSPLQTLRHKEHLL